ncbi:GNAT family N-acetyltransferase [Asticcacaulis sp. YBE204]|uniref:GNAT family N-acetyltransferase n=1 Tax=Asticcacaulis sp. YBE204 TaxID=1282363 RepID=UPI0003C3DD03|nr:GNAT family N-acetyltransferase [Asticcacaulis sp. YBE204]ESQ81218.1 hypothetical protein AEYBE204_02465 [Asticcacaulis sp. YBE204]
MITCDLIAPADLTAADLGVWREMTAQTFAFGSPILSPEFTLAVAKVRDDVKVAVYRRDGKTIAFLPHHRRPNRFARPVGAPFADYTTLISFPDTAFPAKEALALAGIRAFQVAGLIDPYGAFDGFDGAPEDAYGIDLTLDEAAIINNVEKKHLKNINRLRRKLEADHGPVRFVVGDRDRANFEAMLAVKRAQTAQTGIHDFLAADWVQTLVHNLFDTPADEGVEGMLVTLMAGDTPILWHFGPRLNERAHPWVSAFDAAYSPYSPGQIFLHECHKPLREAGVRYYDLSTGQQHYKNAFCNTHTVVRHGRLYADSGDGRASAAVANLAAKGTKALGVASLTDRLTRRLDHMASLELDLKSRLDGTFYAFKSAGKRLRG